MDRTYIASLGFSDPDRIDQVDANTGDGLHDACCSYLSQPEKTLKILSLVFADRIEELNERDEVITSHTERDFSHYLSKTYVRPKGVYNLKLEIVTVTKPDGPAIFNNIATKVSRVISKENGYIVGYADLWIAADLRRPATRQDHYSLNGTALSKADLFDEYELSYETTMVCKAVDYGGAYGDRHANPYKILVEVKRHPVSAARVIQQLNTYRHFLGPNVHSVLCTMYPVSAEDKKTLGDHGYWHIFVSPKAVKEFADKPKVQEATF